MGEGRISSSADLDVWLTGLREAGGEAFDFELAVRSLAHLVDKPLRGTALVKIARVGLEAFSGLPDVPSADPLVFVGRRFDSMTGVAPTTDLMVPRQERLDGETEIEYGGYLAAHLQDWLAEHGMPRSAGLEKAAAAFLILLCQDRFRSQVPRERTLDRHALCMLIAERTMRRIGGVRLSAAEEAAFFRWLHLTTYAEVPDEFLVEQAARRDVRLRHDRQPVDEVAVMTCEVPMAETLPVDQLVRYADTYALSAEGLRASYRSLAESGESGCERWAARGRGFDDTGRLDLTPAAAGRVDYAEYAHGHLLRWLIENDVPVQPIRMQSAHRYARHAVEYLVEDRPEGRDRPSPVRSHLMSTFRIRANDQHLSLADELLFLAWLLEQNPGVGLKLAGFLANRDAVLEKLARRQRRADSR